VLVRSTDNCEWHDGTVEEGITPTSVEVQRILEVPIPLERDSLKVGVHSWISKLGMFCVAQSHPQFLKFIV